MQKIGIIVDLQIDKVLQFVLDQITFGFKPFEIYLKTSVAEACLNGIQFKVFCLMYKNRGVSIHFNNGSIHIINCSILVHFEQIDSLA